MERFLLNRRAACLLPLALVAPSARADNAFDFATDLRLRVPAGFEASEYPGGVEIDPAMPSRNPLSIWISFGLTVTLHTRLVYGRTGDIRYTVDRQPMDGSGGDFFEIRARRFLPDGQEVGLLAYRQSERRPDFSVALDVLASVRYRNDH